MAKLRLHASRLTKRNHTDQLIAVDSVVRWIVLFAFGVLLISSFYEIVIDLLRTHRFGSVWWLFGLLALSISVSVIIKLLEADPLSLEPSLRVGRAIIGTVALNAVTAVLAIVVARAMNPDYEFQTPLLRFSERLLHQFWA